MVSIEETSYHCKPLYRPCAPLKWKILFFCWNIFWFLMSFSMMEANQCTVVANESWVRYFINYHFFFYKGEKNNKTFEYTILFLDFSGIRRQHFYSHGQWLLDFFDIIEKDLINFGNPLIQCLKRKKKKKPLFFVWDQPKIFKKLCLDVGKTLMSLR